ncbi:MAG: UDP-glucose 4-epimerase GalE [Nitrospirae bacterium]|nr:UDP-glucose 4-epimerase GalE [Magnetococcales bacterium]HAT50172.1 UDP-glucose 4-epimerase GalE [Alphaproteobacteria bacterium]
MGRRILVTGGGGYIGAHTVHHLVRSGVPACDIVVLDNLVNGHREFLPAGVVFVQADLNQFDCVTATIRTQEIDRVLHFAGFAYVGESMEYPGKYFQNNVSAGLVLLEAMRLGGCRRIVFSSSCSIFGMHPKIPITEEEEPHPANPYAESKLMFEKALQWYGSQHGFSAVRLRYFNAAGADYGIGPRHEPETRLIPLTIGAALTRTAPLQVFGADYPTPDGTCIRDYIHVTDLAEAHKYALLYLDRIDIGETPGFNLGTGQGTSVMQIIHWVERVSGLPVPFTIHPRRPGDPPQLVADSTRAQAALGWKIRKPLPTIVADAWAWHSGEWSRKG